MMVAVALVATIFGVSDWGMKLKNWRVKGLKIAQWCAGQETLPRQFAEQYERFARNHSILAEEWRDGVQDDPNPIARRIREDSSKVEDRRAEYWTDRAKQEREEAEFYARMRRKFERAASRPWEKLPPAPQNSPYAMDY
jgi:hypothetical protein